MVALVLVATHSFAAVKAPVVAVAPHAAEELPAPATDATVADLGPVSPPPAVDVDDLPHAAPLTVLRRLPRSSPKAQEIVRKVDF
jgi:hypothetical protein